MLNREKIDLLHEIEVDLNEIEDYIKKSVIAEHHIKHYLYNIKQIISKFDEIKKSYLVENQKITPLLIEDTMNELSQRIPEISKKLKFISKFIITDNKTEEKNEKRYTHSSETKKGVDIFSNNHEKINYCKKSDPETALSDNFITVLEYLGIHERLRLRTVSKKWRQSIYESKVNAPVILLSKKYMFFTNNIEQFHQNPESVPSVNKYFFSLNQELLDTLQKEKEFFRRRALMEGKYENVTFCCFFISFFGILSSGITAMVDPTLLNNLLLLGFFMLCLASLIIPQFHISRQIRDANEDLKISYFKQIDEKENLTKIIDTDNLVEKKNAFKPLDIRVVRL